MTKNYKNMITREDQENIAILRIDVADYSMNVFAPGLIEAISKAADTVIADDAVTGVIITSGKDNAFLAGADLNMVAKWGDPSLSDQDVFNEIAVLGDTFRKIETSGKPFVAACNGLALGGGLELTLGCHYRVFTEDAKYGLPEVTLGLLPGAGGTQRVMRLLGIQRAMPFLLKGRPVDGAKAVEMGLAHQAVPQADVLNVAIKALREGKVSTDIAWDEKRYKLPGGDAYAPLNALAFTGANAQTLVATKGNNLAPLAILRCLHDGSRLPFDKAQKVEQKHFTKLLRSQSAQNIVRTMFVTKQAADKLKHRPQGPTKTAMSRIGMLGAGIMGSGIAEISAAAGITVILVDRSKEIVEGSVAKIAAGLDKQIALGRLTDAKRDKILSHIHVGEDIKEFAGCEMVIEAILENMDIKHEAIKQVEAVLDDNAIFASNTSALPIDELAVASVRPQNFIGLHYFSPVPKMALVEVINGKETSDDTLARALDYLAQTRKTPVIVNDGYGFYTTRCVDAYLREGLHLLLDGFDPAVVERAGESLGMPVGPLCLFDEVGADTIQHISHFFASRETGAVGEDRARSNEILDAVVKDGRTGRKGGKGFYTYGTEGSKALDLSYLNTLVPTKKTDLEAAKERLLYAQLVEAARCWDDGITEDASEADLAACLGWAFPAYLGGPMAVIGQIGGQVFAQRCEEFVTQTGARFTLPESFAKADANAQYYEIAS